MTKRSEINEKLIKIYQFILDYYQDRNFTPTVREICAKFSIKSTSTAYIYLRKLEQEGKIQVISGISRGISILDLPSRDFIEMPLAGRIAAGAGNEIIIESDEKVSIPKSLLQRTTGDHFVLKVKGTSMIEAGILEDDYVIIKKQPNAENGQIVAAILEDNKATLKRFYRDSKGVRLHPENKQMQDIIPTSTLIIAGIAVGLYRKSL